MHAHRQHGRIGESGDAERSRKAAARPRTAAAGRPAGPALTAGGLPALQRTAGNAAVALVVEQERHTHGAGCGHQEQPPSSDARTQQPVQRSAVHEVLGSAGRPLDDSLRREMEGRFGGGQSFGEVRVHTGPEADRSAAEIGARAYTSGRHVVLGKEAVGDKHTIAHELTHVVQQSRGPVPGTDNGAGLSVSDPGDHQERAAEANAARVMSGPSPAFPAAPPSQASPASPASPADGWETEAETVPGAFAPAGAAPVQRVHSGRSTRDSTRDQRDRDRRDPSGRTRGSNRDNADDPARRARRVEPPRRGPEGERLWDGTRRQLDFTSEAVGDVLDDTPRRYSDRARAYRYECQMCRTMVFSRGTAERMRETNWYEIDHIEGIIANVVAWAEPVRWVVDLGDGFYREAEAVLLDDAREAANHARNLRVLCRTCNGGARARNSESRHMDTSGARWVDAPYQLARRSASPEPESSRRSDRRGGGDYGGGYGGGGYGGGGGYIVGF